LSHTAINFDQRKLALAFPRRLYTKRLASPKHHLVCSTEDMGANASKCCATGAQSVEHEHNEGGAQKGVTLSTTALPPETNENESTVKTPKVVAPPAAPTTTTAPPASANPAAPPPVANAKDDEYTITLDKKDGSRLGVDVDHQDGSTLLIEAVTGGLVEAWNAAHAVELKVSAGDRVVEVNGIRGDVLQLVDECKKNQPLKMKLRRGER